MSRDFTLAADIGVAFGLRKAVNGPSTSLRKATGAYK
jgi:hypothetical protein